LLAVLASTALCDAKIIPKRDPLDGALDATLIVIMKREAPGIFRVEESFLGAVGVGDLLQLPDFKLAVEDSSHPAAGVERIEPIHNNTRILVFLKPAEIQSLGWDVAGPGNCYCWSHDPGNLDSLRAMALSALDLRRAWEAARDLPDERQRVEALWPYLWSPGFTCHQQTKAALRKIGAVAGDYIAEQLNGMTYRQKTIMLRESGEYRSERLHAALILELKGQKAAWEKLLARRGTFATYDDVAPPGRVRYYPPRGPRTEADEADEISGVLHDGFTGLGGFHDRNDLPFIRESALWGTKYRFKWVDDAILEAFREMPDKANLPVIEAIWKEYSKEQWNNELDSDVVRTLKEHRFPAAIPMLAQFVNVGVAREKAQEFLRDVTGFDFGDAAGWLGWYASQGH